MDGRSVKVHGHRDCPRFSEFDDESDRALFPSVCAWTEDGPHVSAIILRDGRIVGREVDENGGFHPLLTINVVGDDLPFWTPDAQGSPVPGFGLRVAQTFGSGTYDRLRRLRVAVVGCSGTGSPVIEQLARNCVGTLVLVDPDRVEEKNLNRILNATMEDAWERRFKVEVAARAVSKMGTRHGRRNPFQEPV